jgi:hypothetical protein
MIVSTPSWPLGPRCVLRLIRERFASDRDGSKRGARPAYAIVAGPTEPSQSAGRSGYDDGTSLARTEPLDRFPSDTETHEITGNASMTKTRAFTLLFASLALAACESATDLTQGSIEVTASTTGEDIDPDGYTVAVGASERTLAANDDTVTFSSLASGQIYAVSISGIADNCDVSGGDTRSAPVVYGPPTVVTFSITCTAVP